MRMTRSFYQMLKKFFFEGLSLAGLKEQIEDEKKQDILVPAKLLKKHNQKASPEVPQPEKAQSFNDYSDSESP